MSFRNHGRDIAAALLLGSFVASTSMAAQVAYDNTAAGAANGQAVIGPVPAVNQALGDEITPSLTGELTSVAVGVGGYVVPNVNFTVSVYDPAIKGPSLFGGLIGQVGATTSTELPPFQDGSAFPLTTVDFSKGPTLDAGTPYWFILSAPADDITWVSVNYAGIAGFCSVQNVPPGSCNVNSTDPYLNSLKVSVAPVPLPPTAWLMLSGLVGLGAMARKKRGNAADQVALSIPNT